MPKAAAPNSNTQQTSLVLSPKQLAEFAEVDPALPALILEARSAELKRKFQYAMLSLVAGVLVVFCTLGSFVYLVISGHTQAAAALLGAGILGLSAGFVRNRL